MWRFTRGPTWTESSFPRFWVAVDTAGDQREGDALAAVLFCQLQGLYVGAAEQIPALPLVPEARGGGCAPAGGKVQPERSDALDGGAHGHARSGTGRPDGNG